MFSHPGHLLHQPTVDAQPALHPQQVPFSLDISRQHFPSSRPASPQAFLFCISPSVHLVARWRIEVLCIHFLSWRVLSVITNPSVLWLARFTAVASWSLSCCTFYPAGRLSATPRFSLSLGFVSLPAVFPAAAHSVHSHRNPLGCVLLFLVFTPYPFMGPYHSWLCVSVTSERSPPLTLQASLSLPYVSKVISSSPPGRWLPGESKRWFSDSRPSGTLKI